MRVQHQDIGFRSWAQAYSQQGLGLGICIPTNHYRPPAPREVGIQPLQFPLKPCSTGNVTQPPLGPPKVVQAEAGFYTANPALRAPESGGLVAHVLEGRLHCTQFGHAHGPALRPREQRLQSAVATSPAAVVHSVAAVVVVEVVAREEGQAGRAAAGQGQAQVDVLQQLQGGRREWQLSGQADASSRQRGANSRFQRSFSAPSLGLTAGNTGARAPGSLVWPLVAAPGAIAAVRTKQVLGSPIMHRRAGAAGLTAQA